jgi:hypothetical protein
MNPTLRATIDFNLRSEPQIERAHWLRHAIGKLRDMLAGERMR